MKLHQTDGVAAKVANLRLWNFRRKERKAPASKFYATLPCLYRHLSSIATLPSCLASIATLPPYHLAPLPPCLYCHLDILPPCHLAILPKNNLFSRGFAIIQRLPMLKVGVHSGNHFQNCELLKSNPKLLLKTYKC